MMEAVAENRTDRLPVVGPGGGKRWFLFTILGAAPNFICREFQAIAFWATADGGYDFWWLKPDPASPDKLNQAFLTFHSSGSNQNDSKGIAGNAFTQIGDHFIKGSGTFGIEKQVVQGEATPQAFFTVRGQKYYIVCVWQEEMSSMASWNKWVLGKIVYQKDPSENAFFVRPFRIDNKEFKVALNDAEEEGPFGPGPLPTDMIKKPHGPDPQWSS